MNQDETPVTHLLWCMLIALRCAHAETPLTSELARRRFLHQWLRRVRHKPAFAALSREFASLRELLETDKNRHIEHVLYVLWQQSVRSDQCDLLRFRHAKNTLNAQGWRGYLCKVPEETTLETLRRLRTPRNHYLQLTRPETVFQTTGQLMQPLTFQLVINRNTDQFETVFHDNGFAVMPGAEVTYNRALIRIVHIGLQTLPESTWGAKPENLWGTHAA